MESKAFELCYQDPNCNARAGMLSTDHGKILTPVFMPVGTLGSVKAINQDQLEREIEAQIILGNTYHLYLRPGIDTIAKAGGIHKYINWNRPMLTDSGGYQIFSLSSKRKIKEEGAIFTSHIDGSKHLFTPENNVEIQREIGADFIMAFDECTPFPCEYKYADRSLDLTHRWLKRGIEKDKTTPFIHSYKQLFIPIIQGSVYSDLRIKSTKEIIKHNTPIVAIGGLSVGEPEKDLYEMTELVCTHIPKTTGRYLMGVGTPWNLLECIERGIDMFDCVLPSRNARHGLLYTTKGIIQIKNAKWKNDFTALDVDATNKISRTNSKAYVSHLIRNNEMLGAQIATLHNLSFFTNLMKQARTHILLGSFIKWKKNMLEQITKRL